MRVEIILDVKVSKIVEIPDGLDEAAMTDALCDVTPLLYETWDRFAVYRERYVDPVTRVDVFSGAPCEHDIDSTKGDTTALDFNPNDVDVHDPLTMKEMINIVRVRTT